MMNEKQLIIVCREYLYNAGIELDSGNHEGYCKYMSDSLDLLNKELVGDAPGAESEQQRGPGKIVEAMNYDRQGGPEQPAAEPEQQGGPERPSEAAMRKSQSVEQGDSEQQDEKAKYDAAARRKAGNSPW